MAEIKCPECESNRLWIKGRIKKSGATAYRCSNCNICFQDMYTNPSKHERKRLNRKEGIRCPYCLSFSNTLQNANIRECKTCRKFFSLQYHRLDFALFEVISSNSSQCGDTLDSLDLKCRNCGGSKWRVNKSNDPVRPVRDLECTSCNLKLPIVYPQPDDNKRVISGVKCNICSGTNWKRRKRNLYYCNGCKRYFQLTNKLIRTQHAVAAHDPAADQWDLKALIPDLNPYQHRRLSFKKISQPSLKQLVKDYVLLCIRQEREIGSIRRVVITFQHLSTYLNEHDKEEWMDREVILASTAWLPSKYKWKSSAISTYLSYLREFLEHPANVDRLSIPPRLIRDGDYPKREMGNPHDIPKVIFDKINEHLHELPDDAATMWMVGYFCGMRISEIILCPRNCIHQDSLGQWYIEFGRKKINDTHRLPISRELAKVIQQQQQRVDGKYLFPGQNKPIRNIQYLKNFINRLIITHDIRDDNGRLWHFTNHQLRDTRATYLFETGHELAVVSQWLGHKALQVTQKYVNVTDETLRRETATVQSYMVNFRGKRINSSSLPCTIDTDAHSIEYDDHINTPIYGKCGLPLDSDCPHWRACYCCPSFVATREKLPDYIRVREVLTGKMEMATAQGHSAVVDQLAQQADSLNRIIEGLGVA